MKRRVVAALVLGLTACKRDPDPAPPPAPSASTSAAPVPIAGGEAPAPRTALGGQDFPDGVLALTWDDGPDENTLPIAMMLAQMKIVATFFVVGEWIDGQSEEPGEGEKVFGRRRTSRFLKDLVSLDQRVANHTQHHALLTKAGVDVRRELDENQRAIDPYQSNELALFRPPGGAWSDATSRALDADATLRRLVGPVHWDIDRKDWEGSLYCRSENAATECEPLPFAKERKRVKPSVVAKRYLDAIEARKHGVVLLHDRVGHVGSVYALDVARGLLPVLEKGDWVFVAPVLRFSDAALRLADPGSESPLAIVDATSEKAGEVCDATRCARASMAGTPPRLRLGPWTPRAGVPQRPKVVAAAMLAALADTAAETIRVGDINGDGRLDACGVGPRGVACTLARRSGAFTRATVWMSDRDDARRWAARDRNAVALGDINGDKRADLCVRDPDGIRCALAP